MREISHVQFNGTTEQLQARVSAFLKKKADHAKTVGVPAPREDELVEQLASSGETFEVLPDPAAVPQTFDQMKAAAHARINAKREFVTAQGVTVAGKTYQSDFVSATRLSSALSAFQAGMPIPAGFAWRAADDTDTPIASIQDLAAIASAVTTVTWNAHEHARAVKAQVDALPDGSTQQDFDAIVW